MTSLEQLMIRGVRSVGTAEEDAHIIKFLNPLTIISGPNGTGKTTLIEALNYITTGALPAGKLNTFIHSLDIARKPRVDGMVKLQFRDTKGRQCVATKRMNASKTKGGKPKCQSDEFNVLINHNGISKSLSSKVADFQKEILNLFGVPPAILDHVIFCHQEESCWPLSEPKELKIRFDKIFQLTKFVKALDQMKRLKKEYDLELRVLQEKSANAEMVLHSKAKYIQSRNEAAVLKKDISQRIGELREIVNSSTDVVRSGNEELIAADLRERDLDKKRTQYQMFINQLSSVRVPTFEGTEAQLRSLIDEMTNSPDTRDIEKQREMVQAKIRGIDLDMETCRTAKKTMESNLMDLMSSEMHRENLTTELSNLADDFRKALGNSVDILNVTGSVQQYLLELRRELETCQIASRQERQLIQDNLEQKQGEYTRLDVEFQSGKTNMLKMNSDIHSAEVKLKESACMESELSTIGTQIISVEDALSRMPSVDDSRLKELQSLRNDLQTETNQLREEAANMERILIIKNQAEEKENERIKAVAKLEDLRSKHNTDLIAVCGEVPKWPFSDKVDQYAKRCKPLLANAEKEFTDVELIIDRSQQSLKQLTHDIQEKSKKADELRGEILLLASCEPDDVEKRLENVKKRLSTARSELAPLDSKKTLYEQWSSDVRDKSCCPLCERRINSKCGVQDLSTKLLNLSLSFPQTVEKLKEEVSVCEMAEMSLLKASNYAEQLSKLIEDLTKLKVNKTGVESKLALSSETRTAKLSDLRELRILAERINRIQVDVSLMDSLHILSTELKKQVNDLLSELPAEWSMKASIDYKNVISSKEIKRIIEETDRLQTLATDRNKYTSQLQNLRERRIQLGETAGQVTHIEEQLKVKREELSLLMEKLKQFEQLLPISRNELMSWKQRRDEFDNSGSAKERELSAKIMEIESRVSRYTDLKLRIDSLGNNGVKIQQLKESLSTTDIRISDYSAHKSHLETQLNDLNGLDAQRHTLENQLTKMILQRRIDTLKNEVAILESSLQDVESLRTKVYKANREREQAEVERSRILGQLEEVDKKYKDSVHFLSQQQYSSAERIYRDAVIDKVTHEHMIQDMVNYGAFLDNSLLSFHTDKMAAINEILDDLWRRVYKGNDIDTIKIISEAAAATDKRKSYDYRVVMVIDGGAEIDMRERCSAGQKMLACILIRIALADVFGGLCSIIALDEPTTNLDSGKVDHIAEMLNELIAARRNIDDEGHIRGRQFQMIVITHDERLVEKLTLGSRPEFTYVLGKDTRGISYIRRQYADGHQEKTS